MLFFVKAAKRWIYILSSFIGLAFYNIHQKWGGGKRIQFQVGNTTIFVQYPCFSIWDLEQSQEG